MGIGCCGWGCPAAGWAAVGGVTCVLHACLAPTPSGLPKMARCATSEPALLRTGSHAHPHSEGLSNPHLPVSQPPTAACVHHLTRVCVHHPCVTTTYTPACVHHPTRGCVHRPTRACVPTTYTPACVHHPTRGCPHHLQLRVSTTSGVPAHLSAAGRPRLLQSPPFPDSWQCWPGPHQQPLAFPSPSAPPLVHPGDPTLSPTHPVAPPSRSLTRRPCTLPRTSGHSACLPHPFPPADGCPNRPRRSTPATPPSTTPSSACGWWPTASPSWLPTWPPRPAVPPWPASISCWPRWWRERTWPSPPRGLLMAPRPQRPPMPEVSAVEGMAQAARGSTG